MSIVRWPSRLVLHMTPPSHLNWLRLQHVLLLVSRFVGFGRTGHACPALHCDVMSRNPSVTMSTMRVYNNSEGFGSRTQDCQKSSSRCRMRQFVSSARTLSRKRPCPHALAIQHRSFVKCTSHPESIDPIDQICRFTSRTR